MVKTWVRAALVGVMAAGVGGCAVLLLSGGVLGGLAVSDDTVQTEINRHPRVIYRVAKEELLKAGKVTLDDVEHYTLKAATADKSEVTGTIKPIEHQPAKMRIQARKNFLPNIALAHQLSTSIIKRL